MIWHKCSRRNLNELFSYDQKELLDPAQFLDKFDMFEPLEFHDVLEHDDHEKMKF